MSRRLDAALLRRLAATVPGLDDTRVRVHVAGPIHAMVMAATRGRAVALGNHVFLPPRAAGDVATLAHELTHCAQYQAWGPLRYYLTGLREQARDLAHRALGAGTSPYDWRVHPLRDFELYGMEQQGQIVEDALRGDPSAVAILAARSDRTGRAPRTG